MNIAELIEYTKNVSVLYVEDDDNIREQTLDFLKRFFNKIESAVDGEDGLTRFNSGSFDLVITDINMPRLNGIEMIKEIKSRNQDIQIVVTSAHNESEYLIPLINLDIDRFLLKPFDRKLFLSVIYRVCRTILSMKDTQKEQENKDKYNNKLKKVLEVVDSGIIIVDSGEVINANQAALDVLRVKSIISVENYLNSLKDNIIKLDGYLYVDSLEDLIETTKDKSSFAKMAIDTPVGKSIVMINTKSLDDDSYVISMTDVTALDEQEKYNIFTSLPNRAYALEKLDEFIESEEEFKVLIFTISNYEHINKWHGKVSCIEVEKNCGNILQSDIATIDSKGDIFLANMAKNQFLVLSKTDYVKDVKKAITNLSSYSSIKSDSESENKKEIPIETKIKIIDVAKFEVSHQLVDKLDKELELLTV
jgi:YesN/AraC family two-component response regulator